MVPSQLPILLFPFSPTASIPIPYLTTSLWASKSHPSSRYNHSNHQAVFGHKSIKPLQLRGEGDLGTAPQLP